MKRDIVKIIWICISIALITTGCTSRHMAQPEIALVDLQLSEVTLLETGLKAVVRIDNEGRRPLRINGAVYRLYLNDIDVGRGMNSERLTIQGLGSSEQEIVFRISNIGLVSKIQSLMESRHFSYKISGHVYASGGLGFDKSVPVERTGRLDFN